MRNKRIICLLLSAVLFTAVTGCGGSSDSSSADTSESSSSTESQQNSSEEESSDEGVQEEEQIETNEEPQTDSETTEQSESVNDDFVIAMTESYTFTDPEDITFDKRYVLAGSDGCKLITNMNSLGYKATAMYDIIYEYEGKPAGEYQYFITEDEAAAQELGDYYLSMGQNVTIEGNVLYAVVDGDTLEATILTFAGMGEMSEETVEAYAEMMKNLNGLFDYEG